VPDGRYAPVGLLTRRDLAQLMASLRDVLNHIGKPVEIRRGGQVVTTVLGTERAGLALLEPKAEPAEGDELRFSDGRRFRVVSVEAEIVREKIDHYRARLSPA
jgi:hypothetical protein